MRRDRHRTPAARASLRRPPCWIIAAIAACGCRDAPKSEVKSVSKPPTVQVVRPDERTIVRTVGQPSFIESYERTSIFAKLTGYIEKWDVDIGDKVKKGSTLATLFVPELLEDFQTKKATVTLDEERIQLAQKLVEVAGADLAASRAELAESRAILGKYQAEVDRWDTEVKRLEEQVRKGVVDQQILLESTNQWRSAIASKNAAAATITKSEAEVLSREASLAKSKVEVGVARADLAVAVSDEKRIEAWVGYITLTAPYDGIIVARNANTGDFVLPASGDPTANGRSPYLSPAKDAAPIYVVDRTDVVRVFVDVPEEDANYVKIGTKGTVLARAYRDEPIPGSVTRTSWALNVKSRTLRAEIDLPNPGSELLPGMYAYAKVIIERPGVRALPVSALTYRGDQTFCWTYQNGRAVRNEVRTGVSDGDWIEVTNLQRATGETSGDWTPVTGREQIVLGDLSLLPDEGPVDLLAPQEAPKVAARPSPDAPQPGRAPPPLR